MVQFLLKLLLTSLILVTLPVGSSWAQDLVFTSPPREKPAKGKAIYGPVASYLSKLLKTRVVYKYPGNWLNYQRDMRAGKYDIVFDGPHFASWRMVHIGHDMLVKLPGNLQFVLVNNISDKIITQPEQLIGQKICAISPPNLSILSILNYFYRNPVRQPVIRGTRGGMPGVYKTYQKGICKAYVFRTTFFKKKIKEADRKNMRILYKTPALPNQVISAGPRISASDKKRITQSLTTGDGVKATAGIIKRFGGKAKSFIPASNEEYKGYNDLLEGVIFGW